MTDGPTIGDGLDLDSMRGVANAAFVDDALGIEWDELSLERVRAHVVAGPQHHQPYGIVHGGVYCGIVETLASVGAALQVWDDGTAVVGVSNSTDFIRSHREGRLDAVGEPIHVGRSQQLWQVRITRAADGKQVARGQVRLHHLPEGADGSGRPTGVTEGNGEDTGG
ncbi:MAG: PaaI family thioesterase [Nitriliruptorales bacterium]|nr:PaaI family thioesterase [Nitriliruptorales bacterium]